jgi:hypothetical protein
MPFRCRLSDKGEAVMGEKMLTLEQVRMQIAALGYNETRTRWLETIDAHLTQPAQAVDVGAINSVIVDLEERARNGGDAFQDEFESWASALTAALTRNTQGALTMKIFVIMFNDYPEEVCAPGTTEAQADARAAEIKEAYYVKQYGTKWQELKGLNAPGPVYVKAREVSLYTPPNITPVEETVADAGRWNRFRKAAVACVNHQDFSFPERFSEILGDPEYISEARFDEAFDQACTETQE